MALKKEGSTIKTSRRQFFRASPEMEQVVREITEENIMGYFNVDSDVGRK